MRLVRRAVVTSLSTMTTMLRVAAPLIRAAAAIVALVRIARVATAAPALTASDRSAPQDSDGLGSIDVVIPARDEATRIAPALAALDDAPSVGTVIVVDDQSTDDTAQIAVAAGATVVDGAPLPSGWAGKAWALQQGIDASDAEWIVTLDADTRPDPDLPAALVARATAHGLDFVTIGGRFECPTAPARWLHASMLTTLVYRFGPPGVDRPADRTMANGQCMAFRRRAFVGQGAMTGVRTEVVEDIALARRLAGRGWRVAFLDGSALLTVRMFESLRDTWTGWGRSLALPGIEPEHRQLIDLAVVALAQAAPLPRLVFRRGDLLDVVMLAVRLGTLAGTRSAYTRNDIAYWLSPLADTVSVAALSVGISRGDRQEWRGRSYG